MRWRSVVVNQLHGIVASLVGLDFFNRVATPTRRVFEEALTGGIPVAFISFLGVGKRQHDRHQTSKFRKKNIRLRDKTKVQCDAPNLSFLWGIIYQLIKLGSVTLGKVLDFYCRTQH